MNEVKLEGTIERVDKEMVGGGFTQFWMAAGSTWPDGARYTASGIPVLVPASFNGEAGETIEVEGPLEVDDRGVFVVAARYTRIPF